MKAVEVRLNRPSNRQEWVRAVILVGVVYFIIGFGFGELAKLSLFGTVGVWRLGAWVASAVVAAAHIFYERFRLRHSPLMAALHVAVAVALGAFLLALAAIVHASMVPIHAPYWQYFLALVLWPIITGVPSFLIALLAATILGHLAPKTGLQK